MGTGVLGTARMTCELRKQHADSPDPRAVRLNRTRIRTDSQRGVQNDSRCRHLTNTSAREASGSACHTTVKYPVAGLDSRFGARGCETFLLCILTAGIRRMREFTVKSLQRSRFDAPAREAARAAGTRGVPARRGQRASCVLLRLAGGRASGLRTAPATNRSWRASGWRRCWSARGSRSPTY